MNNFAYYHEGHKQLARESGFKAESLNSLENCSHFKRSYCKCGKQCSYIEVICAFVKCYPQHIKLQQSLQAEFRKATNSYDVLLAVQRLANETIIMEEFKKITNKRVELDDTWQLWFNFIFRDCFSYVSLFISISSWDLRIACLKNMSALFAAYDRPCYQKLPSHLADLEFWITSKQVVLL